MSLLPAAFALLLAIPAPCQNPQLEFARDVVDAARNERQEELERIVREQPPRAAFLVRDVLRAASKTGSLELVALARGVVEALEPGELRDRLLGELQDWSARDEQAFALAREYERRVEAAQEALAAGDGKLAEAAASRALEAAVLLEDGFLVAHAHGIRGVARKQVGDWDGAVVDLEEAVHRERELGAEIERRRDLRELAGAHERRHERRNLRGDYQGSLADLLTACELWQEVSDSYQEGRCRVIAGGAFSELARFADAEAELRRALAIFSRPSAARGRALAALGLCLLDQGRGDEAGPLLVEARELARAHGDGHGEAEARRHLARVRLEEGRAQAAEDELAPAMELPASALSRALAWTLRGDAAVARGRRDDAAAYYRRALEAGAGLAEGAWRARVGLGGLYEARDAVAARAHYRAAVEELEHLRSMLRLPMLRKRALAERRRPYLRAALLAARAGDLAEAFTMLEKLQARTLWEIRVGARLEQMPSEPLRDLEIELTRCERELASVPAAERAGLLARRDDLRSRHARERLRLALEQPRRGVLAGRAPADPGRVRGALGEGETLLLYGIGQPTSLCLVLTRGGMRAVELPAGRREIEELVDELFRPMRDLAAGRVDTGNLRFRVRAASALHDKLVAPLDLRAEGGTPRLWIVADGPLRRLPFALLVAAHDARPVRPGVPYSQYHGCSYLGERFEIGMLAAASLVAAPVRPAGQVGDEPLVVGYALPGAAEEARTVGEVLGVVPAPAGEGTVIERAARASVVHLATHAELDSTRPAWSRLRLSPQGDADGWLHAWEIARLDLPGPLVVLSGCETAGHAGAGEGLLGLTRGFLEAGARAVVATAWRVEDRAAAALMADFQKRLADGDEPMGALAECQRAMLERARRDGSPWSHPFFWAGYAVHGRP